MVLFLGVWEQIHNPDFNSLEFDLKRMGKKIGELAAKRKVSIERIAYEGGVSKGYLYDIVRGEGNPSLLILQRISEALDVSLLELFK